MPPSRVVFGVGIGHPKPLIIVVLLLVPSSVVGVVNYTCLAPIKSHSRAGTKQADFTDIECVHLLNKVNGSCCIEVPVQSYMENSSITWEFSIVKYYLHSHFTVIIDE